MKAVIKIRLSLEALNGAGSRVEEEGGEGGLRKSSIKQSQMGEGNKTECWRGALVNLST